MYATALVGAFQHEADHCVACHNHVCVCWPQELSPISKLAFSRNGSGMHNTLNILTISAKAAIPK